MNNSRLGKPTRYFRGVRGEQARSTTVAGDLARPMSTAGERALQRRRRRRAGAARVRSRGRAATRGERRRELSSGRLRGGASWGDRRILDGSLSALRALEGRAVELLSGSGEQRTLHGKEGLRAWGVRPIASGERAPQAWARRC